MQDFAYATYGKSTWNTWRIRTGTFDFFSHSEDRRDDSRENYSKGCSRGTSISGQLSRACKVLSPRSINRADHRVSATDESRSPAEHCIRDRTFHYGYRYAV